MNGHELDVNNNVSAWPHTGQPGVPSFSERDAAHILHDRVTGLLVQRRWSGSSGRWMMDEATPTECANRFSYVTVVFNDDIQFWLRNPYSSLTVDPAAGEAIRALKSVESMLWGVVAGSHPSRSKTRGVIVQERVGCGSTVSGLLCRQFGFDPSETKGRK